MDPEVGGSNPPNCTTPLSSNSHPQNHAPNSPHSGEISRAFSLSLRREDSQIREISRNPPLSLQLQIRDLHFGFALEVGVCDRAVCPGELFSPICK